MVTLLQIFVRMLQGIHGMLLETVHNIDDAICVDPFDDEEDDIYGW